MSELDPKQQKELIAKVMMFSGLFFSGLGLFTLISPNFFMEMLGLDKSSAYIVGLSMLFVGGVEVVIGKVYSNNTKSL